MSLQFIFKSCLRVLQVCAYIHCYHTPSFLPKIDIFITPWNITFINVQLIHKHFNKLWMLCSITVYIQVYDNKVIFIVKITCICIIYVDIMTITFIKECLNNAITGHDVMQIYTFCRWIFNSYSFAKAHNAFLICISRSNQSPYICLMVQVQQTFKQIVSYLKSIVIKVSRKFMVNHKVWWKLEYLSF